MLILVGNSPSSGSTLLSELLDSTELSMSGEELGLFANKRFYDDFRSSASQTSVSKSVYVSRNALFSKGLDSYNLNQSKIIKLLEESISPQDFSVKLINHYKAFRGRKAGVLFEKTPQNLTCIGEFLSLFESSYFIHIVRNPVNVYASLLKRGFPNYIALITWLVDVASFYKYRDHDRVISIKYEDLVAEPYRCVKSIISKVLNVELSEKEIEKQYKNNTYRQEHTLKIKSWSNQTFGKISNSNNKAVPDDIYSSFSAAQELVINKKYAEMFDLEACSYMEMIKYFGYEDAMKFTDSAVVDRQLADYKRLLSKFYYDLKQREAKLTDLSTYLNPVMSVNV